MADVDGTAGGWGDAPPLAGGRGPKREGERHKLSASAAGQAWEHTLLLLTPIFTCRVGGYASVLVLLLTSSILAFFLISPFVLKRMLFNLYPATKERLSYTAAREQAFSVTGIYAIEDQVFNEVGLRRPKEAPFDLLFRAFVLVVLLLLSVLLGLLALLTALAAFSAENITLEGSGWYIHMTVETPWDAMIFFAFAIIFSMAFVACFRLLLKAWRRRKPT